MKASLFMLVLLVSVGATAGPVVKDSSSKTNGLPNIRVALEAPIPQPQSQPTQQPSNELTQRRVVLSGVTVTVVKSKNPLQLVNPWATDEYGIGEARVSHDVLTGRPNGVKLLTIKF